MSQERLSALKVTNLDFDEFPDDCAMKGRTEPS